jgi:hypothetical protein
MRILRCFAEDSLYLLSTMSLHPDRRAIRQVRGGAAVATAKYPTFLGTGVDAGTAAAWARETCSHSRSIPGAHTANEGNDLAIGCVSGGGIPDILVVSHLESSLALSSARAGPTRESHRPRPLYKLNPRSE